jgi:hypothetical protein
VRKVLLCLFLLLAGCNDYVPRRETPVVNIPVQLRQENWEGPLREGSCVYASVVSMLRWQGKYKTAEWVRQHCGGGASAQTLESVLDRIHVRYTSGASEAFLKWACDTRRGAAVPIDKGEHCVLLVGMDARSVWLLDNNETDHFIKISRSQFLDDWRESGSWAITTVYSPAAPLP